MKSQWKVSPVVACLGLIVGLGIGQAALDGMAAARAQGLAIAMQAGGDSLKSQFKRADASGARWALIFGADELARGEFGLKNLQDSSQQALPLSDLGRLASLLRGH